MSKNKHIYPSDHSTPSLEVLNKYLRGELSDDDKARVEAQLEDDPMLADALEGLSIIENPEDVSQAVTRINRVSRMKALHKIPKRERLSKRKSRVAPQNYTTLFVAAAASVAILVATIFVVRDMGFSPREDTFAMENSIETEEPLTESTDMLDREEIQATPVITTDDSTEEKPPQTQPGLIAEKRPVEKLTPNSRVLRTAPVPESEVAEEAAEADHQDIPVQPASPKMSNQPLVEDQGERQQQAAGSQVQKPGGTYSTTTREKEVAPTLAEQKLEDLALDDEVTPSIKIYHDTAGAYMNPNDVENIPLNGAVPEVIAKDNRLNYSRSKKEKAASSGSMDKQTGYWAGMDTMPVRSDSAIIKGMVLKSIAMADLLNDGIRNYDQKQYRRAIALFEEVLQSENGNRVATYYVAGARYQLGEYKLAAKYLKPLLGNSEMELYEESQWLLMNIYLQRGKEKAVNRILKEIVKAGGQFSEEARAILFQRENSE